MNKCDCYMPETSRCMGTKEMDLCDCGGDKDKCSFYKQPNHEFTPPPTKPVSKERCTPWETWHCGNCSRPISSLFKYCPYCGKEIDWP